MLKHCQVNRNITVKHVQVNKKQQNGEYTWPIQMERTPSYVFMFRILFI
jgi:hypothetical protein